MSGEEIEAAWNRAEKRGMVGVVVNYGAARAAVEAIVERAEKCPRGNFVSFPIAVGLTDDEVEALRFALVHGLTPPQPTSKEEA